MNLRQHKPNFKLLISICLLIAMLVTSIGSVFGNMMEADAAKKQKVTLKFNKTSVKLQPGKKTTVKVKKTNIKKIKSQKWSVKNKKIAKVTKKGVVTAIRTGKTTVTCKIKYLAKGVKKQKTKTLKCKITVTASTASNTAGKPSTPVTQNATQQPTVTLMPDRSTPPSGTSDPSTTADPNQDPSNSPATTMNPNITEKPVITSTPDPTSAPTPTQTPAATKTPISADGFEMTSLEFAAQLGAGINIGNSLDSNEVNEYLLENNYEPSPMKDLYLSGTAGLKLETSWGNDSKISREFIHGIKEAGFQTIRLPVTYINHVKTETINGEKKYTIDADWLNRVQEIVDWVLAEDLYIIINIHHDGADNCDADGNLNVYGDEQATWLSPLNNSAEAYAQMEAKFVSLWEQIAVKFKDYSDHLLFADMNEFHHGYNPPSQTWCDVQNRLHQAFVDTVRNTGDNNVKRHLIVPGYNTNIDQTISGLVVPTDIPENQTEYQGNTAGHIMVEVHYYDPYTYAGDDPSDTLWGKDTGTPNWGDEDHLNEQMQKMNTNYVAKGIPVIIGEFGAPEHNIDEATDQIYRTYYYSCVVKSAVQNGIVPITWDNGTTYKLLNRDGSIAEQSIVDAIIKYSKTPSAEIVKPASN